MLTRDRMREQGDLLFRLRGSLPLVLLPLALFALGSSELLEERMGDGVDDAFDWLCLAISGAGLALRVYVAGTVPRRTSGRNAAKGQVADTLNTTGAYAVVRHPLYLANAAIFLGFLLATGSPWFVLVGLLSCCLHYERIILAEEEFLLERFGQAYRDWADETPAVWPRLSRLAPPALAFCWRTAVKREYRTLAALAAAFAILDYAEDAIALGRVEFESDTSVPLAAVVLLFAVVRLVHKRTRLLHAEGR